MPWHDCRVESALEFLVQWHYAGLFLVILAEEGGLPLPLPGDLFIAAMGFLAFSGQAAFAPTAAVVTFATVLGASFLYTVARHAGRPLLVRVARRFGYTDAREARLEGWLARRGAVAVVVGRLVPGLRIVMTVVAGALRLGRPTFVVGTFVAGLVWSTLYFGIGWALAAGYGRVAEHAPPEALWAAAGAALLAIAAVALLVRARARRAPARAAGSPDPQP